jgi:hypothetical protein
MFDLRLNTVDSYAAARPSAANPHVVLHNTALNRFNAARHAAALERIKGLVFRHSWRLFSLAALAPGQVRGRHYVGVKCVSIDQIRGSVRRTGDFDHHFHPQDDRLRDRWVSVAMARSEGIPLPPVNLIQVGDCYFVEDGHHRLSVARAMGQTAIDAEVTVWDVRGPLPWEKQTVPTSVMQPA